MLYLAETSKYMLWIHSKNKEKIVLKELKEIMGWMNELENQQKNRTYINKWIEML